MIGHLGSGRWRGGTMVKKSVSLHSTFLAKFSRFHSPAHSTTGLKEHNFARLEHSVWSRFRKSVPAPSPVEAAEVDGRI